MLTLQELRRSPPKIIALAWIAGMLVFLSTLGERAEEQWAAGRLTTMEDAGPDAAPSPWDDAATAADDLDYLLDEEEAGEDEDDAGEWVPPGEDASDLLVATGEGTAPEEIGDDDGGEITDLDDDVESAEDGGRAPRTEGVAASTPKGGAAPLAAGVISSSINVRSSGESAVLALAASWPLADPASGKDERAARTIAPIDTRIVGTAAIQALDVAWAADPQVAELSRTEEPDSGALARALTRESVVALRGRFRAVVPPLSSITVLERDRSVVLRMGDVDPFGSTDGATLAPSAARTLARVAPVLAAIPDRRFRVVVPLGASTDEGGVPMLSTSLGVARARAVARVLVRHGVLPSHLDWTPGDVGDRALASELWPAEAGAVAKAGVAIVLEPPSPRPIAEPRNRATAKTGPAPGGHKP